jgi:hypothetical protein
MPTLSLRRIGLAPEEPLIPLGDMVPYEIRRVIHMRKIVFLLVFMLAGAPSAVFGAERQERTAIMINHAGETWEITGVFVHTEPGGFYESRFCLTVVTDTFEVAIPPENLISVEVKGENCVVIYQWMGQEQTISGKVTSNIIGGKSEVGYVNWKFDNLKKLTFKENPGVMKEEKPPSYETTLVLTDGTKVPVANLKRISSQPYSAVPLSGVEAGTVFELHNDVGFLRGETAPTIKFEDIKSMEFPTENSITLTFKQGINDTRNEGESDDNKGESDDDLDFLLGDLDDLDIDFGEESDTGKLSPKNWAYGFTGINRKGYFFIHGKHVKAIEFGVEQR